MDSFLEMNGRLQAALGLAVPPVAVTFSDDAPQGIASSDAPAPAGCSFWERGVTNTFVTSAQDHQFCSIGVHTHTLDGAVASHDSELGAALGAMKGLDYVRPGEVEMLPVMAKSHKHVTYGPLKDATQTPGVVLVFAQASQSLILTEAVARVDGQSPVAMGRPACALIPQVVNTSRSAVSMGCCGARAYLDVLSDDVALWAFDGAKLADYISEIEVLSKANTVLTQFHAQRKLDVEAGKSPTVEQSLAALR